MMATSQAPSVLQQYTVKFGLAGLGASPEVRAVLDRWLQVAQTVAVRASLLANHTIITCLEDPSRTLPDISDQKFWYRCLACCGTLRGKPVVSADREIQRAYEELNAIHTFTPLSLDGLWTLLNTMQRPMCAQAVLMLKTTLQPELKHFVRRKCILWERANGTKLAKLTGNKKAIHQLAFYFVRKVFVGRAKELENIPPDLLATLESKASEWRRSHEHGAVLQGHLSEDWPRQYPGLDTPPNKKTRDAFFVRDLVCWRAELHRLRGNDLDVMSELLQTSNERSVLRSFQKNAKAHPLLPLASCSMRYIQLDWTALQDFVKEAFPGMKFKAPKEEISHEEDEASNDEVVGPARKRPRRCTDPSATVEAKKRTRHKLTEAELAQRAKDADDLFLFAFPYLRRRLGKKFDAFQHNIRTDGVVCSILLSKPTIQEKKKKYSIGSSPTPEGRDLASSNPPVKFQKESDCLIGIDPGRRDMIVAVEHFSGETLKYSTKQAVNESGRRKAQLTTLHAFKGVLHEREPLSKYLQRNPSKDSIPSRWRAYLAHVLPCLDVWMRVYQTRSIRRAGFNSYICRDYALDHLCQRICALGNSDGTKRVLVAFGDASVTSSGFGYAPVPQKRLRLRLELIHGARVTLISEFYTSKMCHRCEEELQKCYHRDRRPDARAIHGILSCANCRTEKDCRQFWHRDVNACRNMIRIYLTLASKRKRPGYLCRTLDSE